MSNKSLSVVFGFSVLFSGVCQAGEIEFDDFLGTVGGSQVYLGSRAKDGQKTYSRTFSPWGPADIRVDVSKARSEEWKALGEGYSFTPSRLRDGRPFGYTSTSMQGGGFFLTLKELKDKDANLFSQPYTLSVMGKQLEELSGLPLQEIQAQAQGYGIGYLINQYFDCVDMPEEGDIVLYPNAIGSPHTGVYRKSEPNWNSPYGGTVESKWGFSSPFVFQHDVFFIPDFYGDIVQFYRLKKQMAPIVTLKEETLTPHSYKIRSDGYSEFNNTEKNIKVREEIDAISDQELLMKFPEIQRVKHIDFTGLCYHYAFGKIFKIYSPPSFMPALPDNDWIEKYFSVTTEPQKGDLVCYYDYALTQPVHYGVYDSPNLVESKWGKQDIYKHPPFHVGNSYGDCIRFYRLKPEVMTGTL